jgi:hypothetical protein
MFFSCPRPRWSLTKHLFRNAVRMDLHPVTSLIPETVRDAPEGIFHFFTEELVKKFELWRQSVAYRMY